MICRICLCEDTEDHPLISPCKCNGSTKYIGVGCLKQWLDGKRVVKETLHVNSYNWKGLKCEICNTPFVFSSEQVLNYKIPNSRNYLVLESLSVSNNKTIHVIDFDYRNSVEVGRA